MLSDRTKLYRGSQGPWPGKFRALALLVVLATFAGCDEESPRAATHPAKGSVTFNGKPTPGAFLVLHPKKPIEPAAPNPTGYVDENGTFVLNTYGGNDGAPAGEYDVTIRWHKLVERDGDAAAGPNVLPDRYADPKQSKITLQVAEGSNELKPIKLKR